jgi:hypothetical protein
MDLQVPHKAGGELLNQFVSLGFSETNVMTHGVTYNEIPSFRKLHQPTERYVKAQRESRGKILHNGLTAAFYETKTSGLLNLVPRADY